MNRPKFFRLRMEARRAARLQRHVVHVQPVTVRSIVEAVEKAAPALRRALSQA